MHLNASEPPTRTSSCWSWRKNFTTRSTSAGRDEWRSPRPFCSPSGKSRSGFRIGECHSSVVSSATRLRFRRMKYKRQLMLQDPKLAEEFEANEMHDDETSMDETDVSSSKTVERLTRPKRKGKIKESKCTSHSCSALKNDPWPFDQHEGDSSKIVEKVRARKQHAK